VPYDPAGAVLLGVTMYAGALVLSASIHYINTMYEPGYRDLWRSTGGNILVPANGWRELGLGLDGLLDFGEFVRAPSQLPRTFPGYFSTCL
jgi:hypothetical protein